MLFVDNHKGVLDSIVRDLVNQFETAPIGQADLGGETWRRGATHELALLMTSSEAG